MLRQLPIGYRVQGVSWRVGGHQYRRLHLCLLSIGISTTYIHTIPVDANDAISVKYVGGGKLYMRDSFMDVLLLPSITQ
ncbi:hypothetical protein GQ600_10144 [Phytophthora cactorum]|nr:hypothetical protein GQ600_10144 [Phytophthora cactorum]